MASTKKMVKCPYCTGNYNAQGIHAHIRQKHKLQANTQKANTPIANTPVKDISSTTTYEEVFLDSLYGDAIRKLEEKKLLELWEIEGVKENTKGTMWQPFVEVPAKHLADFMHTIRKMVIQEKLGVV